MGDSSSESNPYTDAILYQYSNDYASENYTVYDPLDDLSAESSGDSTDIPSSTNSDNNSNNNTNTTKTRSLSESSQSTNRSLTESGQFTPQSGQSTSRSLTESGFDPNFEPVYGGSSSGYSDSNYTAYSGYTQSDDTGFSSLTASGSSSISSFTTTSSISTVSSLSSLSSPPTSVSISLNSSCNSVPTNITSRTTRSSVQGTAGSFSTSVGTGLTDSGSRRRDAYIPYFQIKTSLTNLLKDFTGLETPYISPISSGIPMTSFPMVFNKTRNWNEEFQILLDRKAKIDKYEKSTNVEESVDVYEKLSNLEKDFVYSANLYGKIIISEQFQDSKTILPVNVGGIAGGSKYTVNGILFKFVKEDVRLQLYGSDEFAMKAASHEKNGLVSVYHCGVRELRVPLMAYIDYRGYRLMALSLLPINRNTLIYGSNDGGTTVHMDDPRFNDLMKIAALYRPTVGHPFLSLFAHRLNLKQHVVGADRNGMGGKMIYGPADIEGHLGTDGRYYLLDFARLAPPEPVNHASAPGSFLYQLLRLELVKQNQVALSSDAFSFIGRIDGPVHNAEVRKAYKELNEEIIPKFAELVDSNPKTFDNIEEFIYKLHSHGINVRQLGLLRAKVTDESLKNKILLEAVSRVIKNQLRYMLRQEMKTSGASDEPYRKLTVNFLNLLCGGVNTNFTTLYWNDVIKNDLITKFKDFFEPGENVDLFDICVRNNGMVLMKRLSKITGIIFKKKAINSMEEVGIAGFRIVDPDLKEFESVVTRLNMIDYSDGMALFYKARTMEKYDDNKDSQLRMLTMARGRLRAARYSMCSTEEAVYYNAIVEQFVAKLQKNKSAEERMAALESAEQAFEELLKLRTYIQQDIFVSKAKCIKSRAKLMSDSTTSMELYESALDNLRFALQIDKSDVALYLMAKIMLAKWKLKREATDKQQAEKLMQDAINRDPTCPTYAYGMASILLTIHRDFLDLALYISPQTLQPIPLEETKEDGERRKAMLRRIGQLIDLAVTAYPKYYTPKVMARTKEIRMTKAQMIWTIWGWARYSPALVDAILNNIANDEDMNLKYCIYIDETLNILTSQMPKLKKFLLGRAVNTQLEPISNELVCELVNPSMVNNLTHLNLSHSLITEELLHSSRHFENLVKLDLTNCKEFTLTPARIRTLKSLKLVGCDKVSDHELINFTVNVCNLETLYIPDSISPSAVETIANHLTSLTSLRVPAIPYESQLQSIICRMTNLRKLDLIACFSIPADFAAKVNSICKNILKVRDSNGIPHLFTGSYLQRLTARQMNVGNLNYMEISWDDAGMAPIRIDRKSAFQANLPTKWSVLADILGSSRHVKFRDMVNTAGTMKELFTVSRAIQNILL